MNRFKKLAHKNTNTINVSGLHNNNNNINITSAFDFPSLNNNLWTDYSSTDNTTPSSDNLNFIDATNKKIIDNNKNKIDNGLCTIYYDKELKKTFAHNFPKKMYIDNETVDETDDESDFKTEYVTSELSNVYNVYNVKHPELHNGMNKAIKNIMERRDKFIDQYGKDEFIRDYLPKDSNYLYSRYYYKNKYMNYCNNKLNNVTDASAIDSIVDNDIYNPIDEIAIIQYDDLEIDIDLDGDIDEYNRDNDDDDDDDDDEI